MSNTTPITVASTSSRVERFFETARAALSEHFVQFGQRVEGCLSGLRFELKPVQDENATHNRKHSNGFNVFSYIQPNENLLSRILADLLDPRGAHGQGETFLQILVKQLGVTIPTGPGRVTVYREEMTTYITNTRRRIDILIDFGTFGIGIENKPWAGEQTDQVKAYLDHLDRRYGSNFLLLYLSGNETQPESVERGELDRRKERNQFRLLDYRIGLLAWLGQCIETCETDAVRWFLRDFRSYVMEQFKVSSSDAGG